MIRPGIDCPRGSSGGRMGERGAAAGTGLRRGLYGAAVLVGGLAAGCGDPPTGPSPIDGLPRPLTDPEVRTIAASNEFAWDLFGDLHARAPGDNLFISPLSAHMALGMALAGADGATLDAMRVTLGFGAAELADINASYESLFPLLTTLDPTVDMRIGNSAWFRAGFPVEEEYLAALRQSFRAEARGVDFSDPGTADAINAWVNAATNGKIDRMVEDLPANVVFVLLNAIYFKGDWTEPFDPSRTRDADFKKLDGTTVRVPMMSRRGTYAYRQRDSFESVELPYGGDAFRMTVVLPSPGTGLDEVIGLLDTSLWTELSLDVGPVDLLLELPRFKLEWEKSLNEALHALGMGVAFDPAAADFRRMTPASVWIDEVKQKSFVEVNEKGTEAAAATSVIGVTSAPPTVRLDRPFIFLIRERFSNTLLFMGVVTDPASS